jgi:hypothetical protein
MDDKRTSIGQVRGVFRPQPDFKMSEWTVPVKYLDDKGKDKTGDMEDSYSLILGSPEYTEEKEDDPEEMNQNDTVCKNLVNHLLDQPESNGP